MKIKEATKHTPGPWELKTDMQGNDGEVFVSKDGRLAWVFPRNEGNTKKKDLWKFVDPERDANARLIAAAPELLRFVKNFSTWEYPIKSDWDRLIRVSKELVVKAEGSI